MKLVVKYNFYTISVMVLVFVISGFGSYYFIKRALTNELDLSLLRVQHRIQTYVDKNHALPVINPFDDERISFEPTNKTTPDPNFTTVQLYISDQHKFHISRRLAYLLTVNNQHYSVTIANPLEGTKHMFIAVLTITLTTIFILVSIILLINRLMMTRLWRPFYQSVAQIQGFNVSNPRQLSFPKTDIHEFNFLIDNLKLTTGKSAESYQILKEFTENASHEIQTPLAIVQSQLDLLVQDDGLNSKQSEHLITAYRALKSLSRLNQSLLLIAKIDNHQFHQTSKIDLKNKIEDKIKEFGELWLSKDIELKTDLSHAYIDASPELIDIMLNNLFSNSCKHNFIHGSANIELKLGNLTVINTGKRHPLDTGKIFTRFYKENHEPGNNGLGLSIIKKICDQCGIMPVYNFRAEKSEHIFTLSW